LELLVNAMPWRVYPGKETRYPLYRRLGGPHGRSDIDMVEVDGKFIKIYFDIF
jgi:hypothetical protein